MKDICLVLHAISSDPLDEPLVNKALSISQFEIESLIIRLLDAGYSFAELGESKRMIPEPRCFITFDDGYCNSLNFLKIAEKYRIPFTYFLTGYNILNEVPFIWDIFEFHNSNTISQFKSFSRAYSALRAKDIYPLLKKSHKPLTLSNLDFLDKHELVSFANHGFTHQPYVNGYKKFIDQEISRGEEFLKNYKSFKSTEFALPSGLYVNAAINDLSNKYKRIYTIQGGHSDLSKNLVHRISLVNPKFNGDLMSQIKQSFKLKNRIKRRVINLIQSSKLLG